MQTFENGYGGLSLAGSARNSAEVQWHYAHDAIDLFNRSYRLARLIALLEAIAGRRQQLLDLFEVVPQGTLVFRREAGHQVVPIRLIRGSEGRSKDFDVRFRPLQEHTKGRWLRIAEALRQGIGLPPVALIRVGEAYFVRDGHHRISAAAALGQQEIDALVTAWEIVGGTA